MFSLPFFDKLESAQMVLIAGCGGGFDFFCGLPLYDRLRLDIGRILGKFRDGIESKPFESLPM